MFRKPKTATDILSEKTEKINQLSTQADQAVDIVTRTISRFELINQEIDDSVTDIDAYMSRLAQAKEEMSKQRSYNATIISNFSKLLSTPDVEQ